MMIKLKEPETTVTWKGSCWTDNEISADSSWKSYGQALVQWEYEDELPSDLTDEDYSAMFEHSKVDGVRLFPFVEIGGKRYYLK